MPLIPLFEISGSAGGILFRQRIFTGVNVGFTWLATVIFIVIGVAQPEGVKV